MSATFSFQQLRRRRKSASATASMTARRYRRPAVFWFVTIVLAIITARLVARAAQPLPVEWGNPQSVVVLIRDLPQGSVITSDDIGVRSVPSAFVPKRNTATGSDVVGKRLAVAGRRGAPVDLTLVQPASTSALTAEVGRNRRGFALPSESVPRGVSVGDQVDVVVSQDGDGAPLVTISNAKVIAFDEQQLLVSLTRADAASLAAALTRGRATVLLVGG